MMTTDEEPTIGNNEQPLSPKLSVCILTTSAQLAESLHNGLPQDRYIVNYLSCETEFLEFVEEHNQQIDCLIVENDRSPSQLLRILSDRGILLPAILIEPEIIKKDNFKDSWANLPQDAVGEKQQFLYHHGEIRLIETQTYQITFYVDQALSKFLKLAPRGSLPNYTTTTAGSKGDSAQDFVLLQQRRLIAKLKERLGYLGVYYKRDPQNFFRNLPNQERKDLLSKLSSEYRQIILSYFSKSSQINQAIDQFVNQAFFADFSVSQVVEIHMELMDDFAQQLKLEGRSEEILIDYRLTLIDVIAHLCEMYRRSIPREDKP